MIVNEVRKMSSKQDEMVISQQNYFVVKSNDIIQKSRFSMSLQQQKIILFLISKIKPQEETRHPYTVSVRDFCKVCNIDHDNGQNYINVKAAVKEVADKSIWVTLPNGKERLLRWLDFVELDKNNGTINVRFSEDMMPFLIDLKEKYTQYRLDNILPMKSKYGIRLFELLKSYANMDNLLLISIADLKKRMDCEHYTRFPDFRRYALEKAVEDINTYTDIAVRYRLKKEHSRGYTHIEFIIFHATGTDRIDRMARRMNALGV